MLYVRYLFVVVVVSASQNKFSPPKKQLPMENSMTCNEFGKDARFNPHSVTSESWLVFYYYGPYSPQMVLKFRVPSKRDLSYLYYIFEGHVDDDFDWKANMLLRFHGRNNDTVLLVERNDKGRYWLYIPVADLQLGEKVPRYDVQLKQTSDNKYIAFMMCKYRTVYILARMADVPPKAILVQEANKLGYVGKGGKSYLYRGSQWMPVGETEEEDLWMPGHRPTERAMKALENENLQRAGFPTQDNNLL